MSEWVLIVTMTAGLLRTSQTTNLPSEQACKDRAAQINASLSTDQNINVAGPAPITKPVFFATCRPKGQ
ncbi:MAG TPA: hypothetical protein VFB29_05400 [Pseudolabrys sp.]|nr:hypothetical protein [Pseudolabrys sp.]